MEKKTKLTISGKPKKFKNFETSKNEGKKTVFIEKRGSRPPHKGNIHKSQNSKPIISNFKKSSSIKTNNKIFSSTSDFERRKLAEQRATK